MPRLSRRATLFWRPASDANRWAAALQHAESAVAVSPICGVMMMRKL